MPAIAVVSPFLDKRHGTERCVSEQIERLASTYGYDVTIYSQRVEDIAGVTPSLQAQSESTGGRIFWRKVPALPGPHLLNYLWWFFVNQVCRWVDRRFRGMQFDLVYSPGINCPDADVIAVHMVFAEFRQRMELELRFLKTPFISWPRLLHRRLYYRLAVALERRYYKGRDAILVAISHKTLSDLARFYGAPARGEVVYHGLHSEHFSPELRERLRPSARAEFGLEGDTFAWLLIGNDWKKKGLALLLQAVGGLCEREIRLLVVGQDDPFPYEKTIARLGLAGRIRFLPVRRDVQIYYAAADAYVGPSLEDTFALPPAEAMVSGLPVIVSSQAGLSELVSDGEDALVLRDPGDSNELRQLMERLLRDPALCERMGTNAARKMRQLSWDHNAAEMDRIFRGMLANKKAGERVAARSPGSG
jgi:glycosyltransferase involved in cell wall biosynthesis